MPPMTLKTYSFLLLFILFLINFNFPLICLVSANIKGNHFEDNVSLVAVIEKTKIDQQDEKQLTAKEDSLSFEDISLFKKDYTDLDAKHDFFFDEKVIKPRFYNHLINLFQNIFYLILPKPSFFLNGDNKRAGENIDRYNDQDYHHFYQNLAHVYLKNRNVKKFSFEQEKYLSNLHAKIFNVISMILGEAKDVQFYLIEDDIPFSFALPSKFIFFSSSFIQKYIEHEDLLISNMARLILVLYRHLYPRQLFLVEDSISSLDVLSFIKLPFSLRHELNRWNVLIMNRLRRNPYAVLTWLQIMNKNILDFRPLNGDVYSTSQEEYTLKGVLVKHRQSFMAKKSYFSSKDFIRFKSGFSNDKKHDSLLRNVYNDKI